MKSYKKMYMSSYSQENFYVDKFEMGADAYREGYDGINERLRIVSILSTNRYGYGTEIASDNLEIFRRLARKSLRYGRPFLVLVSCFHGNLPCR